MSQTPALLNIKEGEKPYKLLATDWLVDDDGPLMFRFISKLRLDGQIELVFFTQRQDNRKYVLQHISFAESEFPKLVNAIREMIWKLFPDAKIEIEDFGEMEPQNYTAAPLNFWGLLWIKFGWFYNGLINKLRWFFFHKPPKSE